MTVPLIEFRNVSKRFGSRVVLDSVNLSIFHGEITTIIGKSGAGKSVFLKHIIGLLRPDSGSILYEGQDVAGMSRSERRAFKRRFSYMFQNNALFDSMTVFENIALPLRERTSFTEKEIYKRVMARLEQFELADVIDRFPSQISGGMQKRVALARALVTEPDIILFDEPTTGLDPLRKNAVFSMIAHYQREVGFTAVMVSHDIPDVFFISNRVGIISERKIIFEGSPLELEQSDDPAVREFVLGQYALRDDLSSLVSRHELESHIRAILSSDGGLSIILFDIERLDEVRETVGFVAAQRIMQCLGNVVKQTFGESAISSRCGKGRIVTAVSGNYDIAEMLRNIASRLEEKSVAKPSSYKKVCVEFAVTASFMPVKDVMSLEQYAEILDGRDRTLIIRLKCGVSENNSI
jgi:phospholipid/cholesterol/gamma-HCH transport system ATP-binding protein